MTTQATAVPQATWSATLPTWRIAAPSPALRAVAAPSGQGRRESPAEFRRTYSEAEREGLAERDRYLALRSGGLTSAPAGTKPDNEASTHWRWDGRLGSEVLASVYGDLALPRETTGSRLDLFV